jgi:chloramphenicol-sensitive protein RarD
MKVLPLVGCVTMLGVQQWLFMWAPLHGNLLDVSLGYFILPIIMVTAVGCRDVCTFGCWQ